MLTKPIAAVGLVAGVITAAGAGAYLAVRQNVADPAPLVEDASQSADYGSRSSEVTGPEATAVEATEAVVDAQGPVSEEIRMPSPTSDSPRKQPSPTPPPPPPSIPAPTEQVRSPVPEPALAVSDPLAATLAQAAPTDAPPDRTGRAELPTVEGWTRLDTSEPFPESVPGIELPSTSANNGSIEDPDPEPPLPSFVELEIAADSVIGLQVDTPVSTRTAKVEDRVEARVARDVLVADQVAVRSGTQMLGSVVLVEQGGKLRDATRLGVRFHTLVMEDGLQVAVSTETIYREGRPRGSNSVAKIGGAAVGGAILGAIFGGGRGAAIGGSIGAAGGTAAALSGEAEPAGLPPGARLTVRLSRPVTVTVEQ